MGAVFAFIIFVVGIALFKLVLNAGARTVGAAAKAAVGKGTFAGNMEIAFKGMPPLQFRIRDTRLGDQGDGPLAKIIECKGLLPLPRRIFLGVETSVLDRVDEKPLFVLSALEAFQEQDTIAYRHGIEVGWVQPNQGFVDWVRIGVILPEILQPPFSGRRDLTAVVRLINLDDPPKIRFGFAKDHPGILWTEAIGFSHQFTDKGFQEHAIERDEAQAIAVKIAVAVAMADGSLDDNEGEIIKKWITRAVSPFADGRQAELKSIYNDAFRDAYQNAKGGNLSLTALTDRVNEIGDTSTKYEIIELCFDIMAADGVADAAELKTINGVAAALGLDLAEIEKLRDQKIIGLNADISGHGTLEDILGMDPDWDQDRKRKHLRNEFQKWNNRLNTLPEGNERQNAQLMLDRVAQARKNYG